MTDSTPAVSEALEIVEQYARHKRNRVGDFWSDSMAVAKLTTIRAHIADLTRQLAEAVYRRDTANAFGEQCMSDIEALLARAEAAESSLADARRDGERLNWLSDADNAADIGLFGIALNGGHPLRERIDAAMSGGKDKTEKE